MITSVSTKSTPGPVRNRHVSYLNLIMFTIQRSSLIGVKVLESPKVGKCDPSKQRLRSVRGHNLWGRTYEIIAHIHTENSRRRPENPNDHRHQNSLIAGLTTIAGLIVLKNRLPLIIIIIASIERCSRHHFQNHLAPLRPALLLVQLRS